MTTKPLLILVDSVGCRIGYTDGLAYHIEEVGLPDEPSAGDVAQAIVGHLARSDITDTTQGPGKLPGAGAIPGVLGVSSGWCLCGAVPVPDLPPRQRRTAMLFALEEKLPMPVEQVVADFIVTGDTALGIAVETNRLRELIDALEDHGLPVDAVCPTALLGLQFLTASDNQLSSPLVWKDREGLNLFELGQEQALQHWRWRPVDLEDAASKDQVITPALSESEHQWISRCLTDDGVQPQIIEDDLEEAALKTAMNIQTGRVEPLINLRRDALDVSDRLRKVKGHVFAVMAAAAVLLLALIGVFMWRAHAYQQADERYDAAVASLYHETFGDRPQPTSVRRRLNTRLRELKGLAGQEFDDVESMEKISALWLLHDLLERIPGDQRACVLNIKIEGDYLSLDGQARTHSDADRIAAALRRDGRFEVEPPSTSNLKDGGVSFTLHCRPIESDHTLPPTPPHDTKPTSRVVTTGEVLP